jgi:hypothetical protein
MYVYRMTSIENSHSNFEEHFSEHHEPALDGSIQEEDLALTIRALVSTKEAGVIIGKGKLYRGFFLYND